MYDAKVDLYSAAFIMWYICRGQRPLRDMDGLQVAIKASQEGLRPCLNPIRAGMICNNTYVAHTSRMRAAAICVSLFVWFARMCVLWPFVFVYSDLRAHVTWFCVHVCV